MTKPEGIGFFPVGGTKATKAGGADAAAEVSGALKSFLTMTTLQETTTWAKALVGVAEPVEGVPGLKQHRLQFDDPRLEGRIRFRDDGSSTRVLIETKRVDGEFGFGTKRSKVDIRTDPVSDGLVLDMIGRARS